MKDFIEYVKKNKYVIICVTIVVILYALGVVEFLTKAIILLALIAVAIFIGKKLQDSDDFFKNLFGKIKNKDFDGVYYYQNKNDKENKDESK